MNPFHKIRSIFRKEKLDAEMTEEMRHHVELQTGLNLKAGMNPDEARYAALRQFGNVAAIQEQAREVRGWLWLENVTHDGSFAGRSLRKCPGYTSVVVLTLALGIGVNTALFTWFNAAAFRPLPVPAAQQLYSVGRLNAHGAQTNDMAYADFVNFRDRQTVFSGLAVAARRSVDFLDTDGSALAGGAELTRIELETVSPGYFAVFGVPMARGRPLLAADENPARAVPVIVLSHHFWRSQLGGDPKVIGRTLHVRGLAEETLTVVGVAGEEFFGTRPGAPAGWVPALLRPGTDWRTDPQATDYRLTGRLRPGVSREQAAGELQAIANASPVRSPRGTDRAETVVLASASSYLNLTAQHMIVLVPMIGLFGAVFIVSCANTSNLILARTVTRQFELAVRSALGATRRRLLAQLITENVLLGLLGGLTGWVVSAGLLRFAWPWLCDMVPGARDGLAGLDLHADYRVGAFTLVVSLLTGVVGGLWPALHVTRRSVDSALKQEGSAFGRGVRLSRVRSILAVGQLALSSALVFTAALLGHRALSSRFADAGFDKRPLVLFELLAPWTYSPSQMDTARREALARVKSLPDVAAICELPAQPFVPQGARIFVPGDGPGGARAIDVISASVPVNYLDTLQLPLRRGRGFAPGETADDRIAVISETAARQFWPNGEALGRRFEVQSGTLAAREGAAATEDGVLSRMPITVIGVVRDTRVYDRGSDDRPVIYLPLATQVAAAPYLLIRTRGADDLPPPALREAGLAVTGVAPRVIALDAALAGAHIEYQVVAWVAGILAAVSLLVAVIGLYGVMAYGVNQRVKEIGIRLALGATPRRVVISIVLDALRLVGLGAVAGYGLSVLITRVARTLLMGVNALDPLVLIAGMLLLGTLGVLACWLPARRAAQVDPMVTLRTE